MTNSQLENIDATKRRLVFNIPVDELSKAFISRLQSMQKKTKVNGFRPGKVPLSLVRKMHGERVLADAADYIANARLREALEEHKLATVSVGRIDPPPESPDKEWNFAVEVEVLPPFDLPDPATISANLHKAEVTDADVQATLARIAANHPQYVELDRSADKGDFIEVDFTYQLYQDDTRLTDKGSFARGQKERWKLSDSMPIVGMLEALQGVKAGETRDARLNIDDDFPNPAWRGKIMQFEAHVHKVLEEHIPTMDAELAAKLGIEGADDPLAELTKRTRENLQARLEARLDELNKSTLFDALSNATKLDLPSSLIDRHNQRIRRNLVEQYMPPERLRQLSKPAELLKAEDYQQQAEQQARLAEVFTRLVSEKQIKPDNADVQKVITRAAAEYDDPEKFMQQITSDAQLKERFTMTALEQKVFEWLRNHCQVSWQETTMDKVFASPGQEHTQQHDHNHDHGHNQSAGSGA